MSYARRLLTRGEVRVYQHQQKTSPHPRPWPSFNIDFHHFRHTNPCIQWVAAGWQAMVLSRLRGMKLTFSDIYYVTKQKKSGKKNWPSYASDI